MNKQDKVQFTAENYIVFCVCRKLLAAVVVAAAGGGGDVTVGRSCFTVGLHSWRLSHKLNTKFPF